MDQPDATPTERGSKPREILTRARRAAWRAVLLVVTVASAALVGGIVGAVLGKPIFALIRTVWEWMPPR